MFKTELKPEVQKIIDRLKTIDFNKFVYDKEQIKEALYLHLKNLGLPEMPVLFVENFRKGYNAAWRAARSAAWRAARSAAWTAAESAAWSAARSAAESAAWSAARSAAWTAAESAAWSAARSAAWRAARSAAWSAARSAAWSAAENAAWSAALLQYCKTEADFKLFHIWLPFLKAFEAGLWIYWFTEKKIICIPRPIMILKGDLLHCETNAAVNWNNKEKYYFLNGVNVGEKIVMTSSEQLDPQLLLKEQNAEVRREIVRKIGIERVCQKLNAKVLDKKGNYELLNLDLGDRFRPYLKMINPSTGTFCIEGVAPKIQNVEQALNWRNQMNEEPLILT